MVETTVPHLGQTVNSQDIELLPLVSTRRLQSC